MIYDQGRATSKRLTKRGWRGTRLDFSGGQSPSHMRKYKLKQVENWEGSGEEGFKGF